MGRALGGARRLRRRDPRAPPPRLLAAPVWGVVPQDGELPARGDLELMAGGGVASIRLMATWGEVEPWRGARDWEALDELVRETTSRGIQPLLFLYGTPQWVGAEEGLKVRPRRLLGDPPEPEADDRGIRRVRARGG